MGRSKFPGKPSRLVNKKRVSVLQTSENYPLTDNNDEDSDYLPGDHQQTTTFDNGDIQNISTPSSRKKSPSSEPPDGGGGSNTVGGKNSQNSSKNDKNAAPTSGVVTRARTVSSPNLFTSSSAAKATATSSTNSQSKTDINPSNPITNVNSSNSKKDKGPTEKQQPVKKKTVTFKNVLETSDDASAVKKVYNPDNAPLVPIIKKECLSRSVRLARSDCIVRPSRLTEILKNNANKIDKLNSLTFKSASHHNHQQQQSTGGALSPSSTSSLESSSDVPSTSTSSNLHPFHQLHHPLHHHHHHSHHHHSHHSHRHSQLSSSGGPHHDFSTNSPSTSTTNPLGSSSIASNSAQIAVAASSSSSSSTTSSTNNKTELAINTRSDSVAVGDKRFVLPKRSAHSCRVIKPNKRFLDDTGTDVISRNNKTSTTISSSSSSAPASTSTTLSSGGNGSRKQHSRRQQHQNSKENYEENEDDDDDGKILANTGVVATKGQKQFHHHHSSSPNSGAASSNVSGSSSGSRNASGLQDSFINSTLSLKINSSKLGEGERDEEDANSDASQLATDDTQSDDEEAEDVKSNKNFSFNPFSNSKSLFNTITTTTTTQSKVILRQPRLQFGGNNIGSQLGGAGLNSTTTSSGSSTNSPFSLNLISNLGSSPLSLLNSSTCGVCGSSTTSKPLQQSRKFGIYSCESCRKFISKTIKKLAASSGVGNSQANSNLLQCVKGDGTCQIVPTHKGSTKSFKSTFKDRCTACWLKKCIKAFHVPSGLKTRLMATLPLSLRDSDSNHGSVGLGMALAPFTIKTESPSGSSSDLTASSLNLFSTPASKLLSWGDAFDSNHHLESMPTKSLSLVNPLAENNTTFGSSGPLIKPTILEKPVFMVSSSTTQQQFSDKEKDNRLSATNKTVISALSNSGKAAEQQPLQEENTNSNKVKLRRKERENIVPAVAPAPNPAPSAGATPATPTIPATAAEQPKRQRIDLKGPRVKHVCRSASIVLGQPIATFSNESPILDTLDTPPHAESPGNGDVDLPRVTATETPLDGGDSEINCTSCGQADETDLGLSPPATPIERDVEEDQGNCDSNSKSESIESVSSAMTRDVPDAAVTSDKKSVDDLSSKSVTMTRKIASRPLTISNSSANVPGVNALGVNPRNLNAFSKRLQQHHQQVPVRNLPPTISIDFWENYDPAEVSQTGFGLIVTDSIPIRALCFLCGSAGIDPLIFCACCCEPYHQYCVEDEYNLKHSSLDDTINSILDTSINVGPNMNLITNRLNWLCPRCTVCYTCNMSSGSKVKCQKCAKNYHTTCLGTSKRLLGADRPLICANCLKCKSCSTTKVTKFVGNLPMCSQCFKLRKKGNYCPLCQKCYDDNDFDLKMMECGECKRWVHARCEGLSDEQYNMLSTLPENIEFICKFCSKMNTQANLWREAVSAEFKSGLLSVIKLLSKSRQACSLLKLSPRKKTTACTCQPIQSNRNIQFGHGSGTSGLGRKYETDLAQVPSELGGDNEDSRNSNDTQAIDEDIYEFKDASSMAVVPTGMPTAKCFCGASQKALLPLNVPSLVDVKRKVNVNEYVSLAEFNYDMNNVITAAGCDELMIAYKEILSEAFPWFQNETKACTDALEEDMFDSCTFTQNADIDDDQQVPVIDLPDNIDDYFYTYPKEEDIRLCLFCKIQGEGISSQESRLLYCGHNSWVHINCAMWSAEVFEEIDGSLQNVHSAIARGRLIKCTLCGNRGATVGCNVKSCGEHYHYPCARKTDCAFLTDKTVYCPSHLFEADRKKATIERNFEVLRPVYVELDRKKKKLVEPSKVQFLIGSLEVKRIGKLFPKFSDSGEALIPVDFLCKRLYWSIREPWKIVEYTVKTSIQNNMVTFANDTGRNFTVDHTNNLNIVQLGLAQISRWHNSLTADVEETELMLKHERTMKQFLEVVGQNYGTDETTEEEPQNNADLLPPEIKDAIFEDLPHEILDGISMLDILPKLMIYEDMIAIDSKAEGYFTNDYNKDGIMSEEDLNESSQKEFDVSTSWPISANVTHVEDAMLSGVRQLGSSREIKRSKSEVFSRGIGGNRSQQRSSSLTWSCKLDTTSAKRRKLSKGLQDIRLPEGVLLSIGRRKDDFPGALERRRTSQNDECKTKSFTWSAAKKYSQTDTNTQQQDMLTLRDDRFKISQLDGMDDLTNESDYGEYQSQVTVFDPNAVESPVKCDRCNCTYRTHDSYQRHLPTCEPLSTSESESEAAPRSPDMQSPVSHNILISQDLGNGKIQQSPISIMQNFNQASTSSVNGIPITKIQNTLIQGSSQIPIQNNSLTHASISFSNGSGLQNMQIQNIRNSSIPITQLNQGVQNIIFTSQNETSSTQQQTFTQSGSLNGVQQQFIPIQTSVGQFSSTQNIIQAKPVVSGGSHTISLSNNVLQQPGQQQIFAIPSSNGNQILTMNPQQTIITTQPAMQQKPQLIRTQTTPTKMKGLTRMPQTPPNGRVKTKPTNPTKPLQMKRTQLKHENTPKQINIVNQGVPIIRTQAETPNPGIVFQQNANTQPIIVQQMNNPNNIVSYVTADGHNQMQYVTMPSANEFKQPQPQFLTANPLVQGAFLQTDSSGNLVLTNTSSGLQMLSAPLQLAQQTQPQVIGTLIQPQANGLQCGVMSAEQMVLGTGPTLEMVTNSPMLLTSQPVYYGLETIVQNTVMSSQQFVSTAMQGVLSQNASFSATTTQVFQASKIEPIMEVPTGYVVLNNVDGTIMQQPANQTNIISTNVLQQPIQQIHTQPQQIHAQTVQPQQINAQQIQPIYNIQQQSQPQQTHIQQQQQQQMQVQQQQHQQHMQQQQQIHYQQQQQHHQMQQQQTIPATHQTLQAHQIQQLGTTVSPQKPTAKSSPIVVTKIQPQIINKVVPSVTIATSQPQIVQETKANPIIFSKTVTIAPSLDNANNNPIIVQTAAQTPQQQTMVTQSSTPGVYQTAKIVKSNPMSVSQHPLKPKTSSMSGGNSTGSTVPIQPVHRKMNMIRPLSKVSSVSIRPKVVSKPIAAKHVKTSLQSPPLIAPKPHTAAASNGRVLQQTQNRNISGTEQNSPEKAVLQAQFNNFVTNPSNNVSSVADSSGSTVNQPSNQTITMSIDTSNIPIALQNVNLDLNSAGNLIFTQQQYQQPNSNHTIASSLNPQTITLPATSASIQLPSAPYVSQYSSGIPTNVVNPIQQINTHQQSNVVSRPTNRVLPMQTIQQKFSPPTPPEPKLAEIEIKSGDQKDFKTADDSISANVFSLEKDNLEALMQSTIDEADGIPETPETYLTDQQKDEADDELNSALEDVQGEADDDFDLKHNSNEMPDQDDISDTTTPEVKEKICEILENLEEDEDCNKSPLTADDNFNRDVQMMDEKDTLIHQKENVDPVTAAIASAACKDESPLSRSNFVNIPKPTGPRLLYEIQSEDGFTYKSTSISDIWEKVFEAVQVARKAHGLAPLPEGPLADMCGVQMLGLKTNALRYLIEQLPGVERCSRYTPKYHPKPSQIITPYSVEDQEDLKENFYAAARCEPFAKRSDYDMFSWLASRHRKQPVQVVVQTPDMELIPRRGSGSNLPMAMKYRTLKETYKDYVGVFRSHIHGRGLYCTKDIEAGEMVIEYAGELIRSTLTDKRERYYDSKGIGCYMFKIDENLVVDATMRGNAARFINHSCEPNCYSKVVDILGHKHIIIFALRRIVQGEELTYDYKFPFEEVKIPCSCESKKCRKYLN